MEARAKKRRARAWPGPPLEWDGRVSPQGSVSVTRAVLILDFGRWDGIFSVFFSVSVEERRGCGVGGGCFELAREFLEDALRFRR